jgi:membrane protein
MFLERALVRALFVSSRVSATGLRTGRQLVALSRTVASRFADDRCSRAAGALAFTTLFAIVPLMAVALAVFSVLPASRGWMDFIQEFITRNFVPASGTVVAHYVEQFAANAGRLTIWGLLIVAGAAVMLLSSIERTFNDIWHVERPRARAHRLLAYGALLTAGPVLIGASLSMTTAILSTPLFGPRSAFGALRVLVFEVLPVVFELAAFVLLYTIVPNRKVRLRHAFVGGLFACVLFELAKRGFGYAAHFGSYRVVYGAIAALPVFLLWLHVSWLIALLGAVVTATLPEWRSIARQAGARRLRS